MARIINKVDDDLIEVSETKTIKQITRYRKQELMDKKQELQDKITDTDSLLTEFTK